MPEVQPDAGDRRRRAAVVLAAGADQDSRTLLTQPLGNSTVVQTAVANVRAVVDPSRIVVVGRPWGPLRARSARART